MSTLLREIVLKILEIEENTVAPKPPQQVTQAVSSATALIGKGMMVKDISGKPIDYTNLYVNGYYKVFEFPPPEKGYRVIIGRLRDILVMSESPDFYVLMKRDGEVVWDGWFNDFVPITSVEDVMAKDTYLTVKKPDGSYGEVHAYILGLYETFFWKSLEFYIRANGVNFYRIYGNYEAKVLAPILEEEGTTQ